MATKTEEPNVMSREEVLAMLENQPDNKVAVNLYNDDGSLFRTINLPPEFATKKIDFLGTVYTKIADDKWQSGVGDSGKTGSKTK